MANNNLNELVNNLTALGEDKTELEFWRQAFPHMSTAEQQLLLENLEKEEVELSPKS